ncbi:hypothetical protein C0991_006956 [Blastosporella zonata]|nr:hypothetical protein C0991_006956 [Blastosporella zonata]
MAFVGLITTRRRRATVTCLFLTLILELYILATVEIKIPPPGSLQPALTIWVRVSCFLIVLLQKTEVALSWQWHDVILNIRHIIFILLPIGVHYMPSIRVPFITRPESPSNVDTSALLLQIHQTLVHMMPALHFLKYGQAATMRVPDLRARASGWWEEEAKVGAWIREDGANDSEDGARTTVRGVARALGTSFDEGGDELEEGKLRTSAKNMTKILIIDGMKSTPRTWDAYRIGMHISLPKGVDWAFHKVASDKSGKKQCIKHTCGAATGFA